MPHIKDAMAAAVADVANSNAVHDKLLRDYKANGATSNTLQDAERQFLKTQHPGASGQANADLWDSYLRGEKGLTGSRSDMQHKYWEVESGGGGGGSSPLLTGLVSYWPLDEASGNAIDAHGTNHLTDNNAVGATTGKIGGARDFFGTTVSPRNFFRIASNASLTTGDIDFTISFWVKQRNQSPGNVFIGKWDTGSWSGEYVIYRDSGAGFNFLLPGGISILSPSSPVMGAWHHVIAWHDSVNNQIGIVCDNGTVNTRAHSTGITPQPTLSFTISDSAGNPTDGQLDEVGFWKRVLTAQERADLYYGGNGWAYPFVPQPPLPSPLLTGLISYWKLDEASGNALDSHGTNHLTDTNTVGTAAGKVGTARDFVVANSEIFNGTPSAALSTGNIDFTFSVWVRAASFATGSGQNVVFSKWNDPLSKWEFFLFYDASTARFKFYVRLTSGLSNFAQASQALSTGTWYHIVCWHDSVSDQIGISVNNQTPNTQAYTSGAATEPTIPFTVGGRQDIGNYWSGQIDEVAFWKRMLTPAERTELYNAGNGKTYPFT